MLWDSPGPADQCGLSLGGHGCVLVTWKRGRTVPSVAGAGAGASAQESHPPSRSGWLAEADILLGSAGTSPGREQHHV